MKLNETILLAGLAVAPACRTKTPVDTGAHFDAADTDGMREYDTSDTGVKSDPYHCDILQVLDDSGDWGAYVNPYTDEYFSWRGPIYSIQGPVATRVDIDDEGLTSLIDEAKSEWNAVLAANGAPISLTDYYTDYDFGDKNCQDLEIEDQPENTQITCIMSYDAWDDYKGRNVRGSTAVQGTCDDKPRFYRTLVKLSPYIYVDWPESEDRGTGNHEFGHVVGLGHSKDDRYTLMNPYALDGRPTTPGTSESSAVQNIYMIGRSTGYTPAEDRSHVTNVEYLPDNKFIITTDY